MCGRKEMNMRIEEIKIQSPEAPELEIYASVSEPQLRHYDEPELYGVYECLYPSDAECPL